MTNPQQLLITWTNLKKKLIPLIKNAGQIQVYRAYSSPLKVPTSEALTTYNLSQDRIVIAENKLNKAERKLDRIKDLIANNNLPKTKTINPTR